MEKAQVPEITPNSVWNMFPSSQVVQVNSISFFVLLVEEMAEEYLRKNFR